MSVEAHQRAAVLMANADARPPFDRLRLFVHQDHAQGDTGKLVPVAIAPF